ncbi:MAG TPA: glycine/sarcosine/betaine reductase complex component C subunit beta [Syntrophorhabdaceae bacterium]|nr:glycine/sarcosine/betaine reductase complex component C subunit beta [Syntrophorhabdaceae bacterium]HQM82198.1 glycine/sarcosine/betaine reductase complex component C subunit beta [Syntrophorhabdaceae bacterium]
MAAVVKDCSYVLIHIPSFVRYGSKPFRDIYLDSIPNEQLLAKIYQHTRSYDEAAGYPPNQVFIGNLHPDELNNIKQPWYENPVSPPERKGLFGEILPEDEFYAWIKIADDFNLVWLTPEFTDKIREITLKRPFLVNEDIQKLGTGVSPDKIMSKIEDGSALPLYFGGSIIGSLRRDHDADDSLKAHVLMENLLAKASGALAMYHLFRRSGITSDKIDFILNCSEEAVGDRYNRGGGSLSKAIGEMCHCVNASGHDIKAFCAAPIHAIIDAASLVSAGVFERVAVVGGGCLAKIGMKYTGHLKHNMPILEDVLGGFAFLIEKDDGLSPVIRLDCVGKHAIGAASSQQEIMTSLVLKPLNKIDAKMLDIDKYATEMHNPEVTLPAGSGNTPLTNYKIMASLAVLQKEIDKGQMNTFVKEKGMPGFSPTQGHIPAAVPFLGHAIEAIKRGEIRNTMFVAKGSLFLGRMSQLSDGMSFLLEKNRRNRQ